MAARLMRMILGVLILISRFLDPSTRWLSWGIAALLLFEGVTNIRILEPILIRMGAGRSSPHDSRP